VNVDQVKALLRRTNNILLHQEQWLLRWTIHFR
jgi:hypothetical protein